MSKAPESAAASRAELQVGSVPCDPFWSTNAYVVVEGNKPGMCLLFRQIMQNII